MIFFTQRILKHILALPSGVVFLYVGAYLMLRFLFAETHTDGNSYVAFPEDKPILYWVFRPASYADQYLTGMNCHIGKHN